MSRNTGGFVLSSLGFRQLRVGDEVKLCAHIGGGEYSKPVRWEVSGVSPSNATLTLPAPVVVDGVRYYPEDLHVSLCSELPVLTRPKRRARVVSNESMERLPASKTRLRKAAEAAAELEVDPSWDVKEAGHQSRNLQPGRKAWRDRTQDCKSPRSSNQRTHGGMVRGNLCHNGGKLMAAKKKVAKKRAKRRPTDEVQAEKVERGAAFVTGLMENKALPGIDQLRRVKSPNYGLTEDHLQKIEAALNEAVESVIQDLGAWIEEPGAAMAETKFSFD